jgi:hypothetical protein
MPFDAGFLRVASVGWMVATWAVSLFKQAQKPAALAPVGIATGERGKRFIYFNILAA